MNKSPIERGRVAVGGAALALVLGSMVHAVLKRTENEQSKLVRDLEANKNAWKPLFPEFEEYE